MDSLTDGTASLLRYDDLMVSVLTTDAMHVQSTTLGEGRGAEYV